MNQVTLRQLKTFVTVCKQLSFVGAAQELFLTPPAVSLQIKQIESDVGLSLFVRNSKSVQLTQAGEVLLTYAQSVFQQLREAQIALDSIKGVEGGRLVIGMVTTAKYFLPSILAAFKEQYYAVDILFFEGNRDQLLEKLSSGELDLAVMGRAPAESAMISQSFAPNPNGIIASMQHPLSHKKNIPVTSFNQLPFLVREQGSGTRAAMESFFKGHKVEPAHAMVMNSNETIKQAVMVNLGLSFVSLDTVRLEVALGRLAILDVIGLPVLKNWHLVQMRNTQSPAAEAFSRFILTNRHKPYSLADSGFEH